MYKIVYIVFLFLFVGCTDSEFTEDNSISSYVLEKYSETLKRENVKFLKCLQLKDGTFSVNYTTDMRDNSFPSIIRFDYISQNYNVYFDSSYKNKNKQQLLNDIDSCVNEWNTLFEAKKTWK